MGIHFPWKTIQLFCKRSQKTELESLTKKKNQKFKVPVARGITRHLQQLFFWISRRDCLNAVLRANVLNPLGRCLYAAAMHGAGGGQQDAEWANTTSWTPCLPTKCLFSCRRDVCAEVGRWLIKIVIRPFFPWIKWVVCCCRKEAGKQRGRQCTCLPSGPTWRGRQWWRWGGVWILITLLLLRRAAPGAGTGTSVDSFLFKNGRILSIISPNI